MDKKKILILGAKGSLGQALSQVYADREVVGLDQAELDITDEKKVLEKIGEIKPSIIFNCAAYTNVDGAEKNKELVDKVNGLAVGFIARACKNIGAILVHYSTGMIFDGSNSEGYNEDDESKPVNYYGKSKLLGEQELQRNADMYYLIRTCWLYGKETNGKKSFPDIMLGLIDNLEINAVSDEFGSPTYVKDLAQSSRALVDLQKPCGVYHIINEGVASRFNWTQEIFKINNIEKKINKVDSTFFKRDAKRPRFEVLNNNKFIKLRPWQEALEEYLQSQK
jgi:dTDP-4-dehydrorhamnose reductase